MINIISKSYLSRNVSGPKKVVDNLIKGLNILGYPYVVNKRLDACQRLWIHDDTVALAEINKDKTKAVDAGPKDRPDHNGNPLPRGITYSKMKRGNMGYIVSTKEIKRKEFSNKQISLDDLLKQAKAYLDGN